MYLWFAVFIFLANGWLCYELSSWKISSAEQPPPWQNALTEIALVSQFPSLTLSKVVAEYFGLSYTGWAITTSFISILIYFPLIQLSRPWNPRARLHSIRRNIGTFSSSLNPCGFARKNPPPSPTLKETNALSQSEKHA